MADKDGEMGKIDRRLQEIELRLSRLESALIKTDNKNSYKSEELLQHDELFLKSETVDLEEKGLESKIGRFGLAWLGNIVLLFGIIFLTQYLMNLGRSFFSIMFGYIAAAGILYLANSIKKSNVYLGFIFNINAQILFYYVTLRLHFFSNSPIISNRALSVIILLLLVVLQAYFSIRNKSQSFAFLTVVFALTTAIICDITFFMLPVLILAAAGTVYFYYRFNWGPLLLITIFLTYISYFLWLLGNPLMGHPMQLITEQQFGAISLFGLGACFSMLLFFRKKDASSDDFFAEVTITNGILFTLLLLLVVLRFFSTDYIGLFAIISVCCLIYSTILHSRSDWNFATAFYALYGFMAMTIALYGLFGFPRIYLLLSVQSLIVVSLALWFRNRLIIIMNSLLFLGILSVYIFSSKSVNGVNISFALISFISAGIINWKRSRLQIETDILRNQYLIEGFVMVLYALFHVVPKQFITLTWTAAALFYFIISFILKNVKYRYMALGTMICAAFYFFIVDLARIEIIYRVLALLFLAAISIGISMYYTNRVKKSDS
jgi:hypothetical protein